MSLREVQHSPNRGFEFEKSSFDWHRLSFFRALSFATTCGPRLPTSTMRLACERGMEAL